MQYIQQGDSEWLKKSSCLLLGLFGIWSEYKGGSNMPIFVIFVSMLAGIKLKRLTLCYVDDIE